MAELVVPEAEYILRFLAPNVPASVNKTNGQHWSIRHRLVSPWRDEAYWAWRQARNTGIAIVTGQKCKVQVYLPFRTNKRRDPHNYVGTVVKAIVDGLVQSGCWPDDTPEYVEVLEPKLVVYKGLPPGSPLPVEVHLTLEQA